MNTHGTPNSRPPLGAEDRPKPTIPDHEVFERIGHGAYGEVWLARNALGARRAVKVVRRTDFDDERPYQREREGIRRFEPVSRTHENLVDILQFGESPTRDSFYYVMELADPMDCSTQAHQAKDRYCPRTLRQDLERADLRTVDECVQLGLAVASALEHLHRSGLVHRDVKPSNIIYVGGVPKLADIGLVTTQEEAKSLVGTHGYVPPEGSGTPAADIYSLGKVLYEVATGKRSKNYPEPKTDLGQLADRARWLELDLVLQKACESDPAKRYSGCTEMRAELALLSSEGSLRQHRRQGRLLQRLKRFGIAAAILLLIGAVVFWREQGQSRRLAIALNDGQRHLHQMVAGNGVRLMEEGAYADAALWFSEGLRHAAGNPQQELVHQRQLQAVLDRSPRLMAMGFHRGRIRSLQFSRQGDVFATAGADGIVQIWEATTGRAASAAFPHPASVEHLEFSPDGRWLGTACEDRHVRVWSLITGDLRFPGLIHPDLINTIKFSPDGLQLLSGCEDGTAQLWNAATGVALGEPVHHTGAINEVAFGGDGKVFVTASDDGSARLWTTETGLPLGAALRHDGNVRSVHFSPDGKLLATATKDGMARVWTVATGFPVTAPLAHGVPLWTAQFSPDGKWVLAVGGDGEKGGYGRIWDAKNGHPRTSAFVHNNTIRSTAFSSDGRWVATASHDRDVCLWDAATGLRAGSPMRAANHMKWVAFSPDGTRLLAAGEEEAWRLWDVQSALNHDSVSVAEPSYRWTRLSPDGLTLLGCTLDHTVVLVDVRSAKIRFKLDEPTSPFVWAEFSADSQLVLTRRRDGGVCVWNVQTGQLAVPPLQPEKKGAEVSGAIISPDRRWVASYTREEPARIRLWDLKAQGALRQELEHPYQLRTMSFSPNSSLLLTGCGRGQSQGPGDARMWVVQTGKMAREPMAHPGPVHLVRWSPTGQQFVTGCRDNSPDLRSAYLWETSSEQKIVLPVRDVRTISASFSPDGKILATGGDQGGVRLWEVMTGKPISTAFGHQHAIWTTEFSPDGTQLLTATEAHGGRLWDGRSGQPLGPLFRYDPPPWKAAFSRDGEQLIISGRSGPSLRSLRLHRKSQAQWQSAAELAAGCRLDETGSIIRLSPTEMAERLMIGK